MQKAMTAITAKPAEPKIYKAIMYIRLSSADDKPGESDSVTNQRKLILDWVKSRPDIEIAAEKIDDGYSGLTFLERPAFQEMMTDA